MTTPRHLLATLLVCTPVPADDVPGVRVDSLEVAPGVVVFRPDTRIGNPTSVALLGDTRTVLLDASLPDVAPVLRGELDRRGARPVGLVVTTHAHRDHTDGLPYWLAGGATALAPHEQKEAIAGSPVIQEALSAGRDALPSLSFDTAMRIDMKMDGKPVVVELLRPPHRSGHTDGDCLVYVPARKILYVGDYFFLDRYPIVDTGGGGDYGGYFANLDWIASRFPADTIVLPGHNRFAPAPIATPSVADLKTWTARLRKTMALVEAARRIGPDDVEALVARGLGSEFADLDGQPSFVNEERWIRRLWALPPTR